MMCKKKGFLLLLVLSLFLFVLLPYGYGAESICNCQSLDYKFSIRNTNGFQESYNISLDKFSEFISLSEESVLLASGERKAITATLDIPCDLTGNHVVNVVVGAEKSQKTSKIPIELNLNSCYGYDVRFGEEIPITDEKRKAIFKPSEGNYSLCKGEKVAIPILLTNLGVENEYNFDIEGVDWSKLSGKRLKLAKNQRGVVYLSLSPGEEIEGEFEVDFSVINKIGKVEKTYPLFFDVGTCYGVDLDLPVKEDLLCGCESKTYEILVNNTGIFNDTINFLVEPFYAEVNHGEGIQLGSYESKILNLSLEPPCSDLKKTKVKVTGFLESNSLVKGSGEIDIAFIPSERCFEAKIFADKQVTIDYSSKLIPFTIKNEGEIETVYEIEVEGPEWVSSEIESVSLKPGDEVKLNLILEIEGNVTENDYGVRVNLNSKDYSQSKVIILKLRKELPFKGVQEFLDNNLNIILALVFLAAVVFVVLKRKKKSVKKIKLKKKDKKLIFNIAMVILSVILVVAIYYLFSLLNILETIVYFLFWYQYYIYTLVALVVILFFIIMFFVKKKKKKRKKAVKKEEKVKEVKKEEKVEAVKEIKKIKTEKEKSKGGFKKILGIAYIVLITIIIVGALVYSVLQYNTVASEFFVTYSNYIVMGVVLLVALILLIKFNKKLAGLFFGKGRKK